MRTRKREGWRWEGSSARTTGFLGSVRTAGIIIIVIGIIVLFPVSVFYDRGCIMTDTELTCLCSSKSCGVGVLPREYHPRMSRVGKTSLSVCRSDVI